MQMFSLYKCVQHRHGDRFRKSIKSYTTIQGRVQMVKTWHYSACAQLALLETNKTNETLTWTKLLAIDWTESIS